MKLFTVLWILLSCLVVRAQATPSVRMPMGRVEMLALLAGTSSPRVEKLVKERGVSFSPIDEDVQSVKAAGGSDALLDILRVLAKLFLGHPLAHQHLQLLNLTRPRFCRRWGGGSALRRAILQ